MAPTRNSIWLLAGVSLILWTCCVCNVGQDDDIQSLLDSVMINDDNAASSSQKLNLPDANASVGSIFKYQLGLNSQPVKYKIRELGKTDLPDWLSYNKQTDALEGVPRPSDVGVSNIAIIPETPSVGSVKHFFTITILNDPTLTYQKPGAVATGNDFSCRHDDPVTMVTVVIDADPSAMDGADKARVLVKMAEYLKLVQEKLKLLPLDNRPAYDSSALVAGPGDRKKQRFPGLMLTWRIGCGSVDSDSVLLLEKVELTAVNGKLAAALGHPVIGWHVTNNKPEVFMARKRRRAPLATPTYDPTPPTKVESDLDGDLARVVPTMTSPSFSKHHPRRTKTSGRHAVKTTKYRYASPIATPTLTPVVPTPVQTETPSTSSSTEFLRPTELEPSDTETSPEIPIARTDILVQPSHTISQESILTTSSTPSLPTDRYTFVEETATSTAPTTPTTATEVEIAFNENPYISKEMDVIRAKFGEVLYHRIPPKTFMDKEDGNTRHLKLMVLFKKQTLTRMHWLQFDYTNQVLTGMLLDDRNLGRQEFTYTLAAIDSGSKIARTEFTVVVKTPSYQDKGRINHEMSIVIDADYDVFVSTSANTINVIENLGRVFGITNPYKVINVLRRERGSVKFTFTMRNVKYQPCPAAKIREMATNLITVNGTINAKLAEEMHPRWIIKSVSVDPQGSCIDSDPEKNLKGLADKSFKPMRATDIKPLNPPYTGVDGGKTQSNGDGALIQYIIPAVILILALILAIIVACCLHCKRKKKKQKTLEKNNYHNKGIPIIFQDEMDDKPAPASKPLIMPEEKPPQPPGYLGSRDSPNLDSHRLMYTDFDRDSSPPYRPPPPFAGNGTHGGGRPRGVNNHRNPQPYVPP